MNGDVFRRAAVILGFAMDEVFIKEKNEYEGMFQFIKSHQVEIPKMIPSAACGGNVNDLNKKALEYIEVAVWFFENLE